MGVEAGNLFLQQKADVDSTVTLLWEIFPRESGFFAQSWLLPHQTNVPLPCFTIQLAKVRYVPTKHNGTDDVFMEYGVYFPEHQG